MANEEPKQELTEELFDVQSDMDTGVIRCRCVSCQKEIETTLGKLRQKFERGSYWTTLQGQIKFKVPFTKIEVIISFFQSEPRTHQARRFFR